MLAFIVRAMRKAAMELHQGSCMPLLAGAQ